ncbi:MAG: DUF2510 domain-containing protein [Acidimicrobiales bacterium]
MFFYGSNGHESLIFVAVVVIGGFIARSTRTRRRGTSRPSSSGYGAIAPDPPGVGSGPGGRPGPGPGRAPGPGHAPEPTRGWGVARTGIPAGWLPDPTGRYQQRYWSGTAWTTHVQRTGVPGSDPPPA